MKGLNLWVELPVVELTLNNRSSEG